MTLVELEAFVAQIRQAAGGRDDTVIKVVTKSGAVKDIAHVQLWHSSGYPLIHLK